MLLCPLRQTCDFGSPVHSLAGIYVDNVFGQTHGIWLTHRWEPAAARWGDMPAYVRRPRKWSRNRMLRLWVTCVQPTRMEEWIVSRSASGKVGIPFAKFVWDGGGWEMGKLLACPVKGARFK